MKIRDNLSWFLAILGSALMGLGIGFDNAAAIVVGALVFLGAGALILRKH